jgi:hypothetical protein
LYHGLDHGFLHAASIQWATVFTEFYFCEFASFGEMLFKRQILSNIPIFSRSFQKLKRNSKKISMFLHIVQASSEDIKGFLINFSFHSWFSQTWVNILVNDDQSGNITELKKKQTLQQAFKRILLSLSPVAKFLLTPLVDDRHSTSLT